MNKAITEGTSVPVHCVFTPAHEVLLREWFLPSLPQGLQVVEHRMDEIAGRGDFLSPEFLQCIRKKQSLILDSIRELDGKVIIWADVDIVFLPGFDPGSLVGELAASGKDILYQRETPANGEVNTGFLICHCNKASQVFFEQVILTMDKNPGWNEQRAVNHLLHTCENLQCVGSLSLDYYARTHRWPPPQNAKLYHANYTKGPDGVGQKISQFRLLKKYRESNVFGKLSINAAILLSRSPGSWLEIVRGKIIK